MGDGPEHLKSAGPAVRGDCDVVLEAVKTFPKALQFALQPATADSNVVSTAVQKWGGALQFAHPSLRADPDIVKLAVKTTPEALQFAKGGLNQDEDCLVAAGLINKMRTYNRSENALLSVKFGLAEGTSPYSTEVMLRLRKNEFLDNFKFWFPNAVCKSSCDPNFTDVCWPCRGTASTCTLAKELRTGKPSNKSCWRYGFRYQMQKCKDSGGFMTQVEEIGGLGRGQEIETLMAQEVGLKVFRIKQTAKKRAFSHADASVLAVAVEQWCVDGS